MRCRGACPPQGNGRQRAGTVPVPLLGIPPDGMELGAEARRLGLQLHDAGLGLLLLLQLHGGQGVGWERVHLPLEKALRSER